jgi:hypothetical protein
MLALLVTALNSSVFDPDPDPDPDFDNDNDNESYLSTQRGRGADGWGYISWAR